MSRKFLSKSSLSTIARASRFRFFSSDKPEPLCAHHKQLVPAFEDVCKLKSFELKSDCSAFHMKSCGHDLVSQTPCSKSNSDPCEPFVSKPKAKSICPEDKPCKK